MISQSHVVSEIVFGGWSVKDTNCKLFKIFALILPKWADQVGMKSGLMNGIRGAQSAARIGKS